MRQNTLLILFLTFALSILLFISFQSPILAPLATNIYYTIGFPYFLAALLAIFLTAFSAGLANQLRVIGAPEKSLLGYLLRLFWALVDPRPLSSAVWVSVGFVSFFIAFLALMGLIPRCLPSSQVSPHLEISQHGTVIDTLGPEDTFLVNAGTQVNGKTVIQTPANQFPPHMACQWSLLGDGQYRDLGNCSVIYTAGGDDIPDVLTLTLRQSHCARLGDHHFYFQRAP